MEIEKLKSVTEKLKVFTCLAKDSDYISVTEWSNGEGWNIDINTNSFQLTFGELEAINYLTKYLTYNHDEDEE